MGYGYYTVYPDRPGGYMVLATCDKRGCDEEIDRGLGYLCGDEPHGPWSDAPGCGRYYCEAHLGWVGPRGGCPHPRNRVTRWGRTLSCMALSPDGNVVCLDREGRDEPHAWDAKRKGK